MNSRDLFITPIYLTAMRPIREKTRYFLADNFSQNYLSGASGLILGQFTSFIALLLKFSFYC